MSRCHVSPRVIETEIESFLDNFKYVTSLLHSEFSVLDCRTTDNYSHDVVLLSPNDNNRLSWPDDTESVSGPRHSVTTSSDANRNSVTSSSLWSAELDTDPPPFSQHATDSGANVVRSETGAYDHQPLSLQHCCQKLPQSADACRSYSTRQISVIRHGIPGL